MNKVFSCDIQIYYNDTDSIHLNYDDVPNVVKRYNETYGLELVGEDHGNCHVDFSMDSYNSEIYSLFLGKKTYIDMLESTDKDGMTIHA